MENEEKLKNLKREYKLESELHSQVQLLTAKNLDLESEILKMNVLFKTYSELNKRKPNSS